MSRPWTSSTWPQVVLSAHLPHAILQCTYVFTPTCRSWALVQSPLQRPGVLSSTVTRNCAHTTWAQSPSPRSGQPVVWPVAALGPVCPRRRRLRSSSKWWVTVQCSMQKWYWPCHDVSIACAGAVFQLSLGGDSIDKDCIMLRSGCF